MLEAILLKRKPKELVVKLRRAYNDDATPKHVLQHAYYQITEAYAAQARTDPGVLPQAVAAYERLFRDIPDSRYAVTGRVELGNLLLAQGKAEQAVRQFNALATGNFGPEVTRRSKLLVARVEMSLKRYDRAETLLAELAGSTGPKEVGLSQEVKLLRSRALVGQQKFDEAYRGVEAVLAANPSKKVLGMAYCVLGDLFAARGLYTTALTAYLKVPLMYPEADAPEGMRAIEQARKMLRKLGRTEEAKTLDKQIEQ